MPPNMTPNMPPTMLLNVPLIDLVRGGFRAQLSTICSGGNHYNNREFNLHYQSSIQS
jgi:hypothetical protein